MSRPTGVAVLLLTVVTASGVLTAAARADGDAPAAPGTAPPPAAVGCAAPESGPPVTSSVPGATVVAFAVPARTYVRVDAAGTPVEAMTNTRCPPAPTDEVVVVDAAGRPVDGVTLRPALQSWSGNWTRGSWHAWPTG
jgi:hypothetical protein